MSATLSVILVIALLAFFLISITVVKYAVRSEFVETRFMMSALFCFIVATLSLSFWPHAAMTLPFAVPALLIGLVPGYWLGVRTERQKLMTLGIERYVERFALISHEDVKSLTWWSIVNFYSIVAGLLLINLVGFTNIIVHGSPAFVIATSSVGALLIGSILPYLWHLWSLKPTVLGNRERE